MGKTPPKGKEAEGSPRKKAPRLDDAALATAPVTSELIVEGAVGASDEKRCKCNHAITDSAVEELILSLSLSDDAWICCACRSEDDMGIVKARPEKSDLLICMTCYSNRIFCCGVGSIAYPFGHSRAHALKEKHWFAVAFVYPERRGYCFKCNAEVSMPDKLQVIRDSDSSFVAPLPPPQSRRSGLEHAASGDREVAETEPASAWAGEKKPKIQSIPTTPGGLGNTARDDTERSARETVHGQEQELDDIEGLHWDVNTLDKKIHGLRRWMKDPAEDEEYDFAPDDDDDGFFVELNEVEQTALNERLALCRIRAFEKQYQALDNASLLKQFPASVLEENGYYKHYECDFDWFFDPSYCNFSDVEDYQRMVLRVTVEFEDMEINPYNRNTLLDDRQFVQFWEKLSRKTKLIELYIKEKRPCERERIRKVLLYHALKITEDFPSVYKTPIIARFDEFMWGLEADYTFAGFLIKMWELLAKKQMNFADALMSVYNEGKYRLVFPWGLRTQPEPNLFPVELCYKAHLDRIVEKAQNGDDVHQLVMDTIVENFWKPRRYYDYVRKKMRIAEEIGLIPKQAPHKLYGPGFYLR